MMKFLDIIFDLGKELLIRMIPIEKNLFLFTSFDGHYSDSPKCLSECLHRLYPHIRIVWLCEKKIFDSIPDYVDRVDINKFGALLCRGRAHIIIDNVYGNKAVGLYNKKVLSSLRFRVETWLKMKPGQITYTTWHGTPLKKMGIDQVGSRDIDFSCYKTSMILSNKFTMEVMRRITFGKINMLLMGCPRNDILFADESVHLNIKKKIGLPSNKKVVLFAPTFRTNSVDTSDRNIMRSGIDQLAMFDINALLGSLSNRFGGEWILICRFHYHIADRIDWDKIEITYGSRVINGNMSDDMGEYLSVADVLITDASSCMFDYVITQKPCFLFFPDLQHYIEKERGTYLDIEALPFPIAEDFDGLVYNINNFDNDEYLKDIENMKDSFGYVDSPNTGEQIIKYIVEENLTSCSNL